MATWSMDDLSLVRIPNIYDDELQLVRQVLRTWQARLEKNCRRSLYYDTEQAFRDLGIALPPQLQNAKAALGWGTKAVRMPAMRTQFEGLRLPGTDDPFELGETLARNAFTLEFGQAVVAAYTHGMALVTVARGEDGEAPVQIQGHSAESAGAIWDRRRRRIGAAVTISESDDQGPTRFVAYLPNVVLICTRKQPGGWATERLPNPTGRVLAAAVTNDPQLRQPLGRSRITNAVMEQCDMAVRVTVRMEGNAELYSSPQIALLGLDEAAFGSGLSDAMKFKLAQDRVLALTKDQDGDRPSLQQLSQASMAPHADHLRTIAAQFSAETNIPMSALGVVHDQPASAEAIRAAEHDMLVDVTYHNRNVHSAAVREIGSLAVMVRDGLSEPPPEAWKLSAQFADPEFRSMSAQADAVQKLSGSMDAIAQWDPLVDSIFDESAAAQIRAIRDSKSAPTPALDPQTNGDARRQARIDTPQAMPGKDPHA